MRCYNGKKLIRQVRKDYRFLISDSTPVRSEVRQNEHLVRSCCRNIMNAQKDFCRCSQSEQGVPVILEEAVDFCEISSYDIPEDSLNHFLKNLSDRRNLSYSEIACLIPAIEYCCIRHMADSDSGVTQEKVLRTLRILDAYDGSTLASDLSKTEEVLRRDAIYPQLDRSSKELYRERIRNIARKTGSEERKIAVELLKKARKNSGGDVSHVGAYLIDRRRNRWYFPLLGILILSGCALIWNLTGNALIFLLSLIPVFITAKLLCDTFFSRIIKPQILPKIRITDKNCPVTLVTTVSMVSTLEGAEKLLHRLDVLSHRIRLRNVRIGLLLDFPASDEELSSDEKSILALLSEKIGEKNRNGGQFFCAVRKRNLIPEEYRYEAYGRKQGAMIDFSNLIAGKNDAFLLSCGDLSGAEYMITLDTDTEPMPGSVERLIGFMEYPDHKPIVNQDRKGFRYVEKGYAAAAPRVEANPENSYRSPYSVMLSGNAGTELYHNPHFNLYQDLFSEGIFCGKGILRIDLYRELIGKRFATDPILSHDLPEGQILRCANLSDIVFFDEIPENMLSDEKRSHRWIRGDFQNACYLSRKQNRSWLFRFKIIHNLCRALFPVMCFLLIASGIFFGSKAILAGLLFQLFPLILWIPYLFSLVNNSKKLNPIRMFLQVMLETVLNVLLLPSKAYTGVDGAVRGTFRMLTGRKKLEWTTAAKAAQGEKNIGDYFYQLRWQELGFLFLFFPQTSLLGALWMISPVIAYRISQPYRKDLTDKDDLKKDLSAMWKFFADLMNEENHWLAPDNYQQEPLNVVAHRTSPTNIGLGLLSVLGAYDLALISEEEMLTRIEQTLETVKALPKWKGHLYNWYDTQTLKILPPKFVSTVDCGNCAAAFHTLKKGLAKFKNPRADRISESLDELLKQADFSALYDRKKNLFPIGYDVQEDRMTSSYYDLYASEARLTSFYAIMTGQIPIDHWRRLARPAKKEHGNFIVSGWSGTMFEYFMPHIFLPAYRRTLSGEMLKGILAEQIRYTGKDLPWGISESCYYSFDSLLNYQYRAFGLSTAALRRDVSFPKVISPYSTFLAYPWFPSAAKENKRELPRGNYGYYEAVDYRAGIDNPRVVQSFMAHHVGMSFLSGVNALNNKIMQKRFMDTEGEAFQALLAEGLPACANDHFPLHMKEEEIRRPSEIRIDKPDPEHPRVCLLSNRKLSETVSDSGAGALNYNGTDLIAPNNDPQTPEGVFLFVQHKGNLFGTTYAPLYQEKSTYQMFFDGCGTSCYGTFPEFETRISVTVAPDVPVSVRELNIKNNQMTESSFDFFLVLSPTLCDRTVYEAHPEYQDLFLTAEYDSAMKTVSFCRKLKDGELWFSVTSSEHFVFDVRRDSFGNYYEISSGKVEGITKHPIFPALIVKGALEIRGRGTDTVRFYLSAGKTKQESIDGIRRVAVQNFETLRRRYRQAFESLCSAFSIRAADRLVFDQVAARMLMPAVQTAGKQKAANDLPRKTLWKYGISGDYPILTLRVGTDSVPRILPFVKSLLLFENAGIRIDLIILYREDPGYNTPIKTAILSLIGEFDSVVRSRIFALNIDSVDEYLFLQKVSRLFINLERGWKLSSPHRSFRPIRTERNGVSDEKLFLPLGRGGYTKDRGYRIPQNGRSPLRPWSLVLANYRFGTVLNERGLGYTFAKNASENRITPRMKGASYGVGGEKLYAVIKGKRFDLLANADAEFRPYEAIYRMELSGCVFVTEVFIPQNLPAKIIRVTVENPNSTVPEIVYEPNIILGKTDKGTVTRVVEDEKIFFRNAYNDIYGTGVAVLFGINADPEGESLRFRPSDDKRSVDFVLAYGAGKNSASRIADLLSEPKRISKELQKIKKSTQNRIRIDTPDKELNCFVNGFLQQQIRSSRILGRTGPSQPGGAYGFRDQLQDSLCMAPFEPELLKHQILRCCRHQFEEGDVLHWWHPRPHGNDDGIRTRFSDDPFWLVYACSEYYQTTRDLSLLFREVSYLSAPPLRGDESDRYFTPARSQKSESVYSHAIRAFRYGFQCGNHGLILFGSGDWNDGMNRIEIGGETVWGSMFALYCAEKFLILTRICGSREDTEFISQCAMRLRASLEKHAFKDGKYLRGYTADGIPFGDGDSVDLIPQAFSEYCKLSGAEEALDIAYRNLWDAENKIISLLSPPYQPRSDGFPGSIAEYPPGVRENGGQYTHGGIWFARALFEAGKREQASEILLGMNPVSKNRTATDVNSYGAEPYVLAADVYTLPGRIGFAGWTHYTGAAGWYLKTLTENLLGIRREGDCVSVRPELPKDWNGYKAEVRIGADLLKIRVERGSETGIYEGGEKTGAIRLNGAEHEISVIV